MSGPARTQNDWDAHDYRAEIDRLRAELEQARAHAQRMEQMVYDRDKTIERLIYEREMERANSDRLFAALTSAKENLESWGAYAPEYFQTKWDLAGDIAAPDPALAAHRVLRGEVTLPSAKSTEEPTT